MIQLAVTAVGQDRAGIVAGLTGVLVAHGTDVADAYAALLGGRGAMVLVVDAAPTTDQALLLEDLRRIGDDLGLDAVELHELHQAPHVEAREPSHLLTVYGIDHPGIVHAVASRLAHRAIEICELTTRRVDGETPADRSLYVMTLEIAVPADMDDDEVAACLERVSREHDLDIVLRGLFVDDD
jgi:glycine cleavage system transcriptional repressor